MTLSLSKLQECAERATPGRWIADDNIVFADGESVALDCRHNDATFIASMNPQTALALIRVARAAKRVTKACGMDCAANHELTEAVNEISE